MAVVAGGIGVCHTYVDLSADINKAVAIVYNAKVQKPSVCNASIPFWCMKGLPAASCLPQPKAVRGRCSTPCDKQSRNPQTGARLEFETSDESGLG